MGLPLHATLLDCITVHSVRGGHIVTDVLRSVCLYVCWTNW